MPLCKQGSTSLIVQIVSSTKIVFQISARLDKSSIQCADFSKHISYFGIPFWLKLRNHDLSQIFIYCAQWGFSSFLLCFKTACTIKLIDPVGTEALSRNTSNNFSNVVESRYYLVMLIMLQRAK